jgi:hypothetical protein
MKVVDRVGALSGAASTLLGIIGNDLLSTPPGPHDIHPTGEQDLTDLHWLAAHPAAQAGVSVELIAISLMIVFVAYLSSRVRAAGWLAAAALAGGLIESAVKLASASPMLAAYLLRDDLSPQTARVLVDINSAAFVILWVPAGIFVACAAGAALLSRTLGRVLGWGGIVAGGSCTLVSAATGVHVLSAVFVPWLLCMLWVLLVSLRLGLARSREEVPAPLVPAPTAAPVAV